MLAAAKLILKKYMRAFAEKSFNRRSLLSLISGVPLLAIFAALVKPVASLAQKSNKTANPGERIAIPGARSIDHTGFAVPDLEQAILFFTDVFGAAVLWRSAPFTSDGRGPKLPDGLNADPRATARLAMLRLGPNLNVELIEYRISGVRQQMPLSSGLNVGHLAFDVDDVGAAGDYLRAKKVELLEGPRRNTEGPNAGQDSWFFLTPWGMAVELIHRPPNMPFERDTPARLFKL